MVSRPSVQRLLFGAGRTEPVLSRSGHYLWRGDRPTPGGVANVYYDRVKEVSTRWGGYSGQVLEDTIAHELGHLMLGVYHSSQGIMKASWNSRDLCLASRGRLRFLPAQVALLQTAALSLHLGSSPMVLARR